MKPANHLKAFLKTTQGEAKGYRFRDFKPHEPLTESYFREIAKPAGHFTLGKKYKDRKC